MSIASEIERIQTAKETVRLALENKTQTEVPLALRLDEYAPIIENIKTQGKYQSKMAVPSTEQQNIYPDAGYDALSNVLVDKTPLEETTIIPNPSGVEAVPSGVNIGFSKVTVTGDNSLVSSNIKEGVTIYGVTGTYKGAAGGGGDFSNLGVTVSVEAKNGFYAGDRFVGVKNEGVEPEIVSVITGDGSTVVAFSEDLRVLIYSQTIGASTTSIKIGILDSEDKIYTTVFAKISGDMSGVTTKTLDRSICNLEEDGTRMVTLLQDSNNVAGVLIVNINPSAKTASAVYDNNLGMNNLTIVVNEETSYNDGYVSYINNNGVALIGNYLLVAGTYKYNEGNSSYGGYFSIHVGTSSASFEEIVARSYMSYPIYAYSVGYLGGSTAVVNAYSMYWKISYSGGITILSSFSTSLCTYANISKNGKYCCRGVKAFAIDFSEGKLTQISNITGSSSSSGASAIDNSGEYLISGTSIFEVASGNLFASGVKACTSRYFGIVNDEVYFGGAYKCYLGVSSAQYSIYRTQAYITQSDRVYGVVSENMSIGDIGTAQALFNTFGLELASETTE